MLYTITQVRGNLFYFIFRFRGTCVRRNDASNVPGKFLVRDRQIVTLCGVAYRVAVISRKPAADGTVPHTFLRLKKSAWI